MDVVQRLCGILGFVRIPWRISVLMGHSLGFMLHMLSSPLRPGGQRPYNGATPVGGGRWPFHPLILWHSASISCHNMYGPRFRVVPSAGRLVPIVHTSVSDISPHLILNLKSADPACEHKKSRAYHSKEL